MKKHINKINFIKSELIGVLREVTDIDTQASKELETLIGELEAWQHRHDKEKQE